MRVLIMESISERERPVRQLKEKVTTLRMAARVAVWICVFGAAAWVLAWRFMTS